MKITPTEYELKLDSAARTEALIRRWKREVEKSGILNEVKKHEFFVNKATKLREKQKRARILRSKSKKY